MYNIRQHNSFGKRNLFHAILLTAAVIGVSSCSNDDDDDGGGAGPSNYITVESTTKDVKGPGQLGLDDASDKTVHFHNVSFADGAATGITFTVSSYSKEVLSGTYTFSGKKDSGKDFEIVVGNIAAGDVLYDFASGSATINGSGNTYTIDVTGTALKKGNTAAQQFKAHYSGKFEKNTIIPSPSDGNGEQPGENPNEGPFGNYTFNGTTKNVSGLGELDLDRLLDKSVYFHLLQFGSVDSKTGLPTGGVFFRVSSYTKVLSAGTFTFSGKKDSGKDFEIVEGHISADNVIFDFVSGSATVTISGDIYTIDVTGTAAKAGDTAAREFKIHYSGKLNEGLITS